MIHAKHRHITFTIAEELRIWFRYDREMLGLLFEAVNITLSSWAKERWQKRKL